MTNEELAIRIKAGIDTADNMLQLWEQTRRFIRRIASRYVGAAELEDLEQEGYLALYWIVNSKLNNFFKVILPVLNWCQVTERGMKSVIVKPIHIISKLQF